jgi:hypothetical protein
VTGSREAQKRDELAQFERFAAACASVPVCASRQPGEPEPDIVLDCSKGLIGIELTDLLPSGDTTQRGRESERLNLLERAKLLYEQGGHPPVHVYVAWSVEPRLGKRVRADQARDLCELVARHQPSGIYGTEVGNGFYRVIEGLPITFLHTWAARSHDQSDWREGEAHEVKPLGAADLQARVELEEPKLGKYRGAYESLWLVLVVDAGGPSTWATVLDEVWQSTFDSRYDRVFLLDWVRERCGELRLRSRPG